MSVFQKLVHLRNFSVRTSIAAEEAKRTHKENGNQAFVECFSGTLRTLVRSKTGQRPTSVCMSVLFLVISQQDQSSSVFQLKPQLCGSRE